MKKLHHLFFGILAASALTISGCSDDDNESSQETTVAEDKANIQATFDEALNCISVLKNGPAANILLREFLGLSDGEAFNDDWIDDLAQELEKVLDLQQIENNQRFDIDFYTGTYIYSIATESWNKVDDQINRVVFEFPSSPEETTNNTVMTIENYSDTQVQIESETYYLPNTVHANVVVDGIEIFRLRLNDVDYASNNDFEIPVTLDLEIFMNPFTITVNVERMNTTDFVLDMDFTDGANCNWGIDGEVELSTDDFENLTEDDVENVTLAVSINELTIQSLSGIAELIKLNDPDPSENVINTLLDVEVLFRDMKIGDLEIDQDNETVIIFYKDGTSEDSAAYYEDFVDELEALLLEFTGEWD